MKKYILFFTVMAAIVAISTYGALNLKSSEFDLMLQNVSALSNEEDGDWIIGSKMGEKEVVVGQEQKLMYSIGSPGMTYYITVDIKEEVSCCVGSNPDSACDKLGQDSRCPS